ncbi:hypothetical protein W911_15125 [Hyphomicrobium nitrativorans NL23]|uniref:Uncharacterized protein n=1 Tax=Hyphomicrobium nitrativorans NL23 TaxID=1029756 RepID=V5SIQ6_9HYPH|nr:hypothetical protein [Hyphomicrobium nitrativorans]AHB50372.1 hypothetical protein W911_15125 [Hyphomicrobium nitrativorans NL23]
MTLEPAAIERHIEAILASRDFAAAPKMRALLRYVVDATLAGDAQRLKGYAIGVDVFERGPDFDPAIDPIVRVQAGRLRKLLDAYYSSAGGADPIRIDIPRGGYAVTFLPRGDAPLSSAGDDEPNAVPEPSAHPAAAAPSQSSLRWRQAARSPRAQLAALALLLVLGALGVGLLGERGSGQPPLTEPAGRASLQSQEGAITLAVLPFTNMSRDESLGPFADGLADALMTALSRVKSISLASRTSAFQYRDAADLRRVGEALGVRYLIEGGVQRDGRRIRVTAQLIDTLTGAHIWAQDYDRDISDELAVQRELVTMLAAEIRPQLYGAAKRAIEAAHPESATAWQLYLQSTWMPGEARNSLAWEKERIALATRALALDPDLGQASSVLADKLAYLANVDPASDTDEARRAAAQHARHALELAPGDADVIFNISVYSWHAGRMTEAIEATKRTLELDPNHVLARFLVTAVPYTCRRAPKEVLDELTAFDAEMSPDNPVRWLTLYWLSRLHLNNGDLDKAHDAARRAEQIFRSPDSFYQLAAILVQLGDAKGAVAQIDQQRANWPNLDPRHYADATVARRCEDAPNAARLHRIYSDLAEAVEAASADR